MRVSTLLVANTVETRGSLLSVLGGGWEWYEVQDFPWTVTGDLGVVFELAGSVVWRSR
jgi:hypothetical protein